MSGSIRTKVAAVCAIAALSFSLCTPAAAADSTDKLARDPRIRQSLERIKADDALTLREQIELAETPSPPFKETARAKVFLSRMQAAGLQDAYIDKEGNVIGLRKGTGKGPLLVLSAHLDTVFPEGTDVKVQQRDGRYYGRGLTDDSRGLAAVLTVLRAMQGAGVRTVGDVMFVGTVGEEGLGDLRGVKALFRDHANIDGFISVDSAGEEGGKGHSIVSNATGSHRWEISFAGPGGHSFGSFGTPSAIQAMGRAIAHISDVRPPANPKTTFTVGVVSGGTSVNTIASDAKMLVDIRSNSAQSLAETEKLVMAAIEKGAAEENARWSSSGIRFEAKLLGDRPAGTSPPGSPVTQAALQAWKALRLPAPEIETASTDSNVAIHLGIPAATLSGGGEGGGAHGPDEWYKPVDAYHGPQTLLLTTLALVGVEKVTSPQLPVRSR